MRRHTLLLLCIASSLGTAAHAQALRDRSFCDQAPIFEGVNGEPAPNLIGRNTSSPKTQSAIGHNEVRRVGVNGSEPAGTIVSQWPQPGVPVVNHFLLLCVSAGNLQPPPTPPPPQQEPPPPPQPQKCPDGTVAPIGTKCQKPQQPEHTTQLCPDGSTIDSTATCPGPKPDNPCPGGKIDPATEQCQKPPPPPDDQQPPPPVKCADGTVQPAGGTCPPAADENTQPKGCPEGTSKAADGTCQATGTDRQCEVGAFNPATGKCEAQPPPKVAVPDVSGEPEEQATQELKQAGFTVTRLCCEKSPYGKGRVAYTLPGPGEEMPQGSEVAYMMSEVRWPTWLLVLVGLASAVAVAALAWLAIPKRPRMGVRLPLDPTATVVWGDPIAPEIEIAMPAITSTAKLPPDKERDK